MLLLGVTAVAIVALAWLGVMVRVMAVRADAQTVADLAALGAARSLNDPWDLADPCAVGAQVADRGGAALGGCRIEGTHVIVSVSLAVGTTSAWQLDLGRAEASARAGPVE